MNMGPFTAEQAIADTRRLMKEGFVVVTVEGAEPESIWCFLFQTVDDSIFFRMSMDEVVALYPSGRVADRVIERIARNYEAVRYTFQTETEALKCRALSPAN